MYSHISFQSIIVSFSFKGLFENMYLFIWLRWLFVLHLGASLVAQMVKRLPAVRETRSIPGLGRSPGEGNGNPLQYSYLENSMD